MSIGPKDLLAGATWYRQSAYQWKLDGLTVYIDPWGLTGDLPTADLVLITHYHFDHFSKVGAFDDPNRSFAPEGGGDLGKIAGPNTVYVAPPDIAAELSGNVKRIAPGDRIEAAGIKIEAVPAYNVVEERLGAHPKENGWVGYVLDLGGRTIYHAGDTDHVPDLERVRTDVTFVPIGGTYTMDVSEAAGLVRNQRPKLAVPMHYGFMVGEPADAERFKKEAAPVEVRLMTPTNRFER